MKPGDAIPELRVTPDSGATARYAEASGDANPIHTDPDFARRAGLPGVILHGLYSMAQAARASVDAQGGDPRRLKRLAVQFRGMGVPERELTVSGVMREGRDGRLLIDLTVSQAGRRLIRRGEAEVET